MPGHYEDRAREQELKEAKEEWEKKNKDKYDKVRNPNKPVEDFGLPDPEQEDLSQGVNYSKEMDQVYKKDKQRYGETDQLIREGKLKEAVDRHPDRTIQQQYADLKVPNAGEEGEQFNAWPNIEQGVNQSILQEGGKWGAAALGTGLTVLQKFGEGVDWVGDHILGIPGTDIDLYHARRALIDPLEEQGFALGLLGEILLPDAFDFATFGASYIPRRFIDAGVEGIKLWAKIAKNSGKLNVSQLDELKAAGKLKEADDLVKATFGKKTSYAYASDDIPIDETNSTIMAVLDGMSDANRIIRRDVLIDKLNDPPLREFLLGKKYNLDRPHANLLQELADEEDFMSIVSKHYDELAEKYPNLVERIQKQKDTFELRWKHVNWHHVNPTKGPIDLYRGLETVSDRRIIRDFLIEELGVFSGNHPLNNRFLPQTVHNQIHDWLGTRIGVRSDVLKAKWSKKLGIDVGELKPGSGFMKNHLELSMEGKVTFDKAFMKLSPQERLPYIKEYGEIIKESEGILGDLMRQYDSLYAAPAGYHLTPSNDVMLEFLEALPTDGSRLLQTDLRNIIRETIEEKGGSMLKAVNDEGAVKWVKPKSAEYRRTVEIRKELKDPTISLRKKKSLKAELEDLEQNQLNLDIEGSVKSAGWKKRLQLEKQRREGK